MDRTTFRALLKRQQLRLVKEADNTSSNTQDILGKLLILNIQNDNREPSENGQLPDTPPTIKDIQHAKGYIEDDNEQCDSTSVAKQRRTEPAPQVEIWNQLLTYNLGLPDNQREFGYIRLVRRIEELEAEKKNLLDNLKHTKRALQDHLTMWSIYLREGYGPKYSEAKRLENECRSAVGKLDQLSNGPHTVELLPEGHPWRQKK